MIGAVISTVQHHDAISRPGITTLVFCILKNDLSHFEFLDKVIDTRHVKSLVLVQSWLESTSKGLLKICHMRLKFLHIAIDGKQ